jgi:ABC-type sugar transport system substrate-binding protein
MKDRTIGLFLLSRENEYQRLQEVAARTAAQRVDTPLDVHFSDDAYVQTKQIYDFVHEHPPGSVLIVESVVDESLAQVARHAALAGMGWFLLHRVVPYLDQLRREFPALPIGTVTSNQRQIGRIQGKHFEILSGGEGLLLYVQGPAGSSIAADRLLGMREVISLTALKQQLVRGDWSEQSGEAAVAKWLEENPTRNQLTLLGCQNDAMAVGAARALARAAIAYKRPELGTLPITGVDGNPEYGMALVKRQRLAATIVMPPAAGKAVELVHDAWTTPGVALPPIVELPVHSFPELSILVQRAPASS